MKTGFGILEPGSGSSATGLDLRALDQLGIKRLVTDSRRVKRGDTFIALIAGKGHEAYQEAKGVKRPFSDIAVARAALRGWGS
jgi:UDP-N-acetylmuramyl pentapeptide synthase